MAETDRARLPVASLSDAQKKALAPLFYEGDIFKDEPEVVQNPDGTSSLHGVTPIRPGTMERTSLTFEIMVSGANSVDGESGEGRGVASVSMAAPTGMDRHLVTFPASAAFGLPPHGNPYTGATVDEEGLPKEIPGGSSLVSRLKALAKQTGRPVIADFYRSQPIYSGSRAEIEKPAAPSGKLDASCIPDGYLWWTGGKSLFFRKRDWFRQKRYEVPDAWRLAFAKQLASRQGQFLVADLSPLADLTVEQLVGLQDGKADRRNYGGLPEALQIVHRVALAHDPLFPLPNDQGMRIILAPLTRLDVQPLLADFADRYSHPEVLLSVDPQNFGFRVRAQQENKKGTFVSFELDPQLGKQSMAVGYLFQIPLTLPNDRRDQTRVTIR